MPHAPVHSGWTFVLAQTSGSSDSASPLMMGAGPESGTASTPATGATPAQPQSQPPGSSFMFIVLGALVFFMVFQTIMGGRRERKARQAMMSALKKHDRVVTIGGLIGTVVDIDDHEVVLRIDENANTRVRFTKPSIQTVLNASTAPAPTKAVAEKAAV